MPAAGPGPAADPAALLRGLFADLLGAYGPQGWWPAETAEEVVIGAVLTQAVSWRNVERAIGALRAAGLLDLAALAGADPAAVAPLIRPAGYFNAKARKLGAVARFVSAAGGLAALRRRPGDGLRAELLGVYGVGPETADAILCYALDRPAYVADAYSRRVAARLGLAAEDAGYEEVRGLFEAHLPADAALLGEIHALLVRLCKEACHRSRPDCPACPLLSRCATGRRHINPGGGADGQGCG